MISMNLFIFDAVSIIINTLVLSLAKIIPLGEMSNWRLPMIVRASIYLSGIIWVTILSSIFAWLSSVIVLILFLIASL
jgi:hypothetical protein